MAISSSASCTRTSTSTRASSTRALGIPREHVHRDVRHRPHGGLGRALAGDDAHDAELRRSAARGRCTTASPCATTCRWPSAAERPVCPRQQGPQLGDARRAAGAAPVRVAKGGCRTRPGAAPRVRHRPPSALSREARGTHLLPSGANADAALALRHAGCGASSQRSTSARARRRAGARSPSACRVGGARRSTGPTAADRECCRNSIASTRRLRRRWRSPWLPRRAEQPLVLAQRRGDLGVAPAVPLLVRMRRTACAALRRAATGSPSRARQAGARPRRRRARAGRVPPGARRRSAGGAPQKISVSAARLGVLLAIRRIALRGRRAMASTLNTSNTPVSPSRPRQQVPDVRIDACGGRCPPAPPAGCSGTPSQRLAHEGDPDRQRRARSRTRRGPAG